jgi:DNA-binding XRE family transcriptional regulator
MKQDMEVTAPEPARQIDMRAIRDCLGLSQSEFAALLGFSTRAVQSCEQGWRRPSAALEKAALLLLLSHLHGPRFASQKCWQRQKCTAEQRGSCMAYRARQGHLCWFLTGTVCGGKRLNDWEEKRDLCFRCGFFREMLGGAKHVLDQHGELDEVACSETPTE